jgi:hypothetical protein
MGAKWKGERRSRGRRKVGGLFEDFFSGRRGVERLKGSHCYSTIIIFSSLFFLPSFSTKTSTALILATHPRHRTTE